MKNLMSKKNKVIAFLASTSLVTMTMVALPSAARAADPSCTNLVVITQCVGATSDGAPYVVQVPAKFTGTLFLFSHGYRHFVDIPAGIPVVGGYTVTNTPQPAPGRTVAEITQVATSMLGKGYAVAGSGFARQGWNVDSGLKTNVELIAIIKKQFPKVTKVVAWGESLGGFITQALAEKYPTLVDAAAPLCMAAGSVEAALTMAGDAVWGLKTFFDPTIVGSNYAAGAAGYAQAMGDIVKVLTVAGTLQALISANPTAPAWPATSKVPDSIKAIPSRSALVLVGVMSGVPTQSAHFDNSTGPGDPTSTAYVSYASAISPALGTLENIATAAILGIMATYDVELQSGGTVFDNTKTDYAARLGSDLYTYGSALSGLDAASGMLAYLSPLNPAAPRVAGNAKAIEKMRALASHTGKINVPTITLGAVADNATPAGHDQWLGDRAAEQLTAARAAAKAAYLTSGSYTKPVSKFMSIWQKPPTKYSKYTATGAPDTTPAGANGTGHCNTTPAQNLAIADLAYEAANTGALVVGGKLLTTIRKAGGLTYDPGFRAQLLKFYSQG
jgi:pimeloyl-ACP methyl ester carboxylesterase